MEEIDHSESDEYKTRLFQFDFIIFACELITESLLEKDVLKRDDKS